MEANPVEAYFDHLEDTETGTDVDMISNGGLIAAAAGGGGGGGENRVIVESMINMTGQSVLHFESKKVRDLFSDRGRTVGGQMENQDVAIDSKLCNEIVRKLE